MTRANPSSPVTIVDWRHVDGGVLGQCYRRERTHWRDVLRWETSWTWTMVERARVTWGLPGFVALDRDGNARGWSFQLIEHGTVRVGGLVTDSVDVTARLIDRIVDQARDLKTELVSCFIASRAPGLARALAARGFACEPFEYLARELTWPGTLIANPQAPRSTPQAPHLDPLCVMPWDHDVDAAADLFAHAYDARAALHFTTSGTLEEWRTYVRQLVEQPAVGSLDESATVMVRDDSGLVALALVTTLAPDTAHLAQFAVRPDRQGQGLAGRILAEVLQRSGAERRHTMTLLVADTNRAARHLYHREHFRPTATFVAGRLSLRSSVAIRRPRRTQGSKQID